MRQSVVYLLLPLLADASPVGFYAQGSNQQVGGADETFPSNRGGSLSGINESPTRGFPGFPGFPGLGGGLGGGAGLGSGDSPSTTFASGPSGFEAGFSPVPFLPGASHPLPSMPPSFKHHERRQLGVSGFGSGGLLGGLGGLSDGSAGETPTSGSTGAGDALPSAIGGGAGGALPSGLGGSLGGTSSSTPGLGGSSSGSAGGGASAPGAAGGASSTGSGSSTADDLKDSQCKPVTLIFARGTGEAGNVGSVVGPGLISNLQQQLGANNVAAQGVDYPASAAGNVPGGDSEGPQTMAQLVQQAASQCGSTQIVLGGYSQGASVVHQAAQQFQGDAASKIKAAVLFGDPADGQQVQGIDASALKEFCASGDAVCETHSGTITSAHLSYSSNGDLGQAATFAKGKVEV